jgi:hypothetical protein
MGAFTPIVSPNAQTGKPETEPQPSWDSAPLATTANGLAPQSRHGIIARLIAYEETTICAKMTARSMGFVP